MTISIKSKKFQDLKAKWYKKLADTGFQDIEQDENNLKEWDSYAFCSRYNRHLFSSKETYYRLAGQFLNDHEFENKKNKIIWELHSEGKTITHITNALKSKRFSRVNRAGVHNTIRALAKEMLKKYESSDD